MEAGPVDTAKRAALQWHFGLVTEPPTDRVGKEFLAQYATSKYQCKGDALVRYPHPETRLLHLTFSSL